MEQEYREGTDKIYDAFYKDSDACRKSANRVKPASAQQRRLNKCMEKAYVQRDHRECKLERRIARKYRVALKKEGIDPDEMIHSCKA